jgi:hypothetical protein
MIYAQYLRLNLHVGESNITLVRRARRMLSPLGRSRQSRDSRHVWLRELIAHHAESRGMYINVMRGRI